MDSKEHHLNRTTIIIPSYSRHYQIRRYVRYLSKYSCRVIIADGSDKPLYTSKEFIDGLAHFTYIHKPGKYTFLNRIIESLIKVQTDYFCLMDDSDILVIPALSEIESWLDTNNGYFASGQVYNLSTSLGLWQLRGWGHWQSPLTLSQESPIDRISFAFNTNRTANLFYCVIPSMNKTEIIRKITQIENKDTVMGQKNFELLFSAIILSELKFQKLNVPFWIRTQIEDRDHISTYPPFNEEDSLFVANEVSAFLNPFPWNYDSSIKSEINKILLNWVYKKKKGLLPAEKLIKTLLRNTIRGSKFVAKAFLGILSPSLLARLEVGSRYLASERLFKASGTCEKFRITEYNSDISSEVFYALGVWTYFGRDLS